MRSKGGDGDAPILRIDRILVARKGFGEGACVIGNGLELAHRRRLIRIAEARRTEQRLLRLLFERFAIAAPMLLEVQRGVEDRRRVARIFLPEYADRLRQSVARLFVRQMAMRAAHIAVHRNAIFEKEAPAQFYARDSDGVLGGGHDGDRLEVLLRVIEKLL